MVKPIILCVDDEKIILDSLEEQIQRNLGKNYDVEVCQSAEEGLDILEEFSEEGRNVAVVVSDQMMPGMKGDEFLVRVNSLIPETLKILLTGQASLESVRNAINKASLFRYVNKPWEEHDLMMTIKEAADSFDRYIKLQELNHLLKQLNKASQEISGEVNIDVLFQKLMRNAMITTGAEKGCILMCKGQDWAIRGVKSIINEEDKKYQIKLQNDNPSLTQDILKAIQSQKDNPQAFRIYAPIIKNTMEMGALFLESAFTRQAFDENHIEIISMLSAQAAISLENAYLYVDLEEKTTELQADKEKIETINAVLEEKNNDITNSIRYANKIQASILPELVVLKQNFADSFVLHKAKDIVSGDFYWWVEKGDNFWFAAVDCTGHGVPGAFMSVIGSSSLSQSLAQFSDPQPDEVLSRLHQIIRQSLKQEAGLNKDGMDLALCKVNKTTMTLSYAGANRPLFLVRDNELTEIDPSKYAIGGSTFDDLDPVFESHTLNLELGDALYVFSDGYADQFGGPNTKKLTNRRFKELLLQVNLHPMEIQSELINHTFEQWKGDVEQTDDVLVIGVRINSLLF